MVEAESMRVLLSKSEIADPVMGSCPYPIFSYWDMSDRNFLAWLGEYRSLLIKRLTASSFSLYHSFSLMSSVL